MAEYSRLAKGTATVLAAGGCAPIKLPFQPDNDMMNIDDEENEESVDFDDVIEAMRERKKGSLH